MLTFRLIRKTFLNDFFFELEMFFIFYPYLKNIIYNYLYKIVFNGAHLFKGYFTQKIHNDPDTNFKFKK